MDNIKKRAEMYAYEGIILGLVSLNMVGMGIGVVILENVVDHVNEYCPLCDTFGLIHQVEAINNNEKYTSFGYSAEYLPKKEIASVNKHLYITDADDNILYQVPQDYQFVDGKLIKLKSYLLPERVLVKKDNKIVREITK